MFTFVGFFVRYDYEHFWDVWNFRAECGYGHPVGRVVARSAAPQGFSCGLCMLVGCCLGSGFVENDVFLL